MARIIEALKELGKKLNTGGTAPTGETVDEVINSIAEGFDITGATGADGASVTAIELELTDGVVTGGTATLSDETTVSITVTTAES